MRTNSSTTVSGFTLLEVVVALAIVASTIYAGFFLINRIGANNELIQTKLLAHWVATNELALAELDQRKPENNQATEAIKEMYGLQFLVRSKASTEVRTSEDGDNFDIEILRIEVALADNPSEIINTLSLERESP